MPISAHSMARFLASVMRALCHPSVQCLIPKHFIHLGRVVEQLIRIDVGNVCGNSCTMSGMRQAKEKVARQDMKTIRPF